MRDSLAKKDLEQLKNYALNIENYSRNGEEIYGGLHDYVDKLSKEDIIKYILTACLKKKELLDEKKNSTQSFNQIYPLKNPLKDSEDYMTTSSKPLELL